MAAAFLASIYTYEHRGQNENLGELRNSESTGSGQVVDDVAESRKIENGPQGSDVRRAESIKQFLSAGKSGHAWKELCHRVVGKAGLRKAIGDYDLQEYDRVKDDESEELLQWVLTLDAIVLACLLDKNFCRAGESMLPFLLVRDCVDQHSVYGTVPVEDFIKLENPIPLFLPRKVLNLMCTGIEEAKTILNDACSKLARDCSSYLPGHDPNNDDVLIKQLKPRETDGVATEEHSLGKCGFQRVEREQDARPPPATAPLTTLKGFNVPSAT